MSPVTLDEKIGKFREVVEPTAQVGVSEFARSKAWRKELGSIGCFEVVDHGDTVGYMLAPDYAMALSQRLDELEEQVEKLQIAAMFGARRGRLQDKTGDELKAAALAYFEKNGDALAGVVYGG